MSSSNFTFNLLEVFYRQADFIEKDIISSIKSEAETLGKEQLYTKEKAERIASKLLKKGFQQFEEKLKDTYKDKEYTIFVDGLLKIRSGKFFSPFSSLSNEIQGLLSRI